MSAQDDIERLPCIGVEAAECGGTHCTIQCTKWRWSRFRNELWLVCIFCGEWWRK